MELPSSLQLKLKVKCWKWKLKINLALPFELFCVLWERWNFKFLYFALLEFQERWNLRPPIFPLTFLWLIMLLLLIFLKRNLKPPIFPWTFLWLIKEEFWSLLSPHDPSCNWWAVDGCWKGLYDRASILSLRSCAQDSSDAVLIYNFQLIFNFLLMFYFLLISNFLLISIFLLIFNFLLICWYSILGWLGWYICYWGRHCIVLMFNY